MVFNHEKAPFINDKRGFFYASKNVYLIETFARKNTQKFVKMI